MWCVGRAGVRRGPGDSVLAGEWHIAENNMRLGKVNLMIFSTGIGTNVRELIEGHIASQPESKQRDMRTLHTLILQALPGCRLWFDDGKDGDDKTITNPTAGYGLHTITYADGSTREFFQIGMSANSTGISIYILGIKDRTYLVRTYGKGLGKAKVTGYCIRFRHLADIDTGVLEAAIRDGVGMTSGT